MRRTSTEGLRALEPEATRRSGHAGAPAARRGARIALAACVAAAALLAPALAPWGAPSAEAEIITLKNGYEIEGWIVEENEAQVVVAVIVRGTVGTLTFSTTEIASIDRTREESLEEALARERARIEAAERARRAREEAERRAREGEAEPEAEPEEAPEPDEEPEEEPAERISRIVVEPTPEELEQMDLHVLRMGDTRRAGGAGIRRANATEAMGKMGPQALGILTQTLNDGSGFRRQNAADAIAMIARADDRIGLYLDAIPRLVDNLLDPNPWVRIKSNEALEAISGERFGSFDSELRESVTPEERQIVDRWQAWWRDLQRKVES